MADENAADAAIEKVTVVEVDRTMSDLVAAARRAEALVPLTEAEAEAMTAEELAKRADLIFSHCKLALMSERDFILKFRVELNVLRRKTSGQGRRLPIPGCPTWGEVKKKYFRLSSRQVNNLLADPGKPKAQRKPKPKGEEPEPEGPEPEVLEPDQPLPVTDAEVARIHEAAAAAEESPTPSAEMLAEEARHLGFPPAVLGILINTRFADWHSTKREMAAMLERLDLCVLLELSYECESARAKRLTSGSGLDWHRAHPWPKEAAEKALAQGGFWTAGALYEEADVHGWQCGHGQHAMGVSLEDFRKVLLEMRQSHKLATRMLGKKYWYCRPEDEARLKAASKAEGPDFHFGEDESIPS
jgi:hypothetical protein